jgi:cytoskeleton protein RodZ
VITLVKRTIDKYEKESQITSDFNATLSPPNTSPRQIEHEAFPSDMAPIAHDSPTSPVPDSVSGIQKLDSAVTEANDGTQATPKLQPSPDPAPTASPTPLSAAISPVESSPSPSPTPSPVPSPPTTNAVAKPSSAESKPDAAELTTGAEINGQELIIEALDGLQIEYSIDGGSSKKVKLKPEQLYTIKGRQSILLKVNNGGAINLIHNGADKGVPGDLGRPLEVEFK